MAETKNVIKKPLRYKLSEIIGNESNRLLIQIFLLIICLLFTYLTYSAHMEFLTRVMQAFTTAFLVGSCLTFFRILSSSNTERKEPKCIKCNNVGLKDVKHSRVEVDLDNRLRDCKKGDNVNILLVSLDTLTHMKGAFRECVKNGANVQICVYNPAKASTYLELRALPDETTDSLFTRMYESLLEFYELNKELLKTGKQMKIKISNKYPSTILFSINSDCFVPFMLYHKYSNEFIHLHFCFNDCAKLQSNLFKEHFEEFFEAAKITIKSDDKLTPEFLENSSKSTV